MRQVVVREMHVLDVQRMLTVLEIQRMHAHVTTYPRRITKLRVDVFYTEMLDGSLEKAFKQDPVGHLVHHWGKDADIRKHDVGGTNDGVESHVIHEVAECRIVVIKHVKVEVELTVVGLHLHAVEEDALGTDDNIRLEVFELQAADFVSRQTAYIGMDGIAQDIQVFGLQVDAFEVDMRIVHQMLFCLLRIVFVLVPEHKIHILQRDLVDGDGHRLGFGLLLVALESFNDEVEVKRILPFVLYQVGFGIAQFHLFEMQLTRHQVRYVDFGLQRADFSQVIASQVFNDNVIQKDTKIGGDGQTAHLDVGTSFFRKISTSKTHRKLLNDRVLYGNKEACDDGQQHHNHNQNAMDNLFFNNFDPPN